MLQPVTAAFTQKHAVAYQITKMRFLVAQALT
jgi:hypothetical protein